MDKWADYFISQVSYDSDHLISVAIRHQDTDKGITIGEPVDRLTIHSDITNGLFYITIYSGKESWKKGHKIQTFSIGGNSYIRIDENKVKLDHLGDLPEGPIVKSESVKELEFQPEPPSSPRGSLPKGFTKEIHPEPTPEPPSSPRGSLPKGFTKEIHPEPTPEPEEEEATPQQIAQLADLQEQIDDLEDLLSSHILSESEPKEEEATPQQIAQLDILQKQINELEKEIKKSKSTHIKRKITKPKKQSKSSTKKITSKSIHIKRKITKPKKQSKSSTKKITSKSTSSKVYCRKCKTKRKIKNPKQTTMKNGKVCVKGFCSVCKGKVFRVGKIKK